MRTATIPPAAHVELFNRVGARAGPDPVRPCRPRGAAGARAARPQRRGAGPAYRLGHRCRRRRRDIWPSLLDAPAMLNHMSRLVIDPNRRPGTATSIPPVSDGCVVPGQPGAAVRPSAIDRVVRYFLPYHRAVAHRIGTFRRAGIVPAVIADPQLHAADERRGPALAGRRAVARRPATGRPGPAQRWRRAATWWSATTSPIRACGSSASRCSSTPSAPGCRMSCSRSGRTRSPPRMRPFAMPRSSTTSLRAPLADPDLYRLFEGDNLDRAGGLISWRHAIGGSPLA